MKQLILVLVAALMVFLVGSCAFMPATGNEASSNSEYTQPPATDHETSQNTEHTQKPDNSQAMDDVPNRNGAEEQNVPGELPLEAKYGGCMDKGAEFFVYHQSIYCRENERDTLLWEKPAELKDATVSDLFVWEDSLYFLTYNSMDAFQLKVWELCLSTQNVRSFQEKEWKTASYHESLSYDGNLFLEIGFDLYCFDLTTKEITHLLADVSGFSCWNGKLFCVDKMEKTFTIYCYNLKTQNKEIFLGDGIQEEQESPNTQYRDIVCVGEDLFYYQWFPTGIYCYNANEPVLISENDAIIAYSMFSFSDCLYFLEQENEVKLIKYDPEAKEFSEVCVLEDFDRFYGDVHNGIMKYYGTDGEKYLPLAE
ncbi:MAG: hypothetical protein IJF24_03620 [Clostridia bacterium]|nr:hypothetical protein [Clostridia bacterium]